MPLAFRPQPKVTRGEWIFSASDQQGHSSQRSRTRRGRCCSIVARTTTVIPRAKQGQVLIVLGNCILTYLMANCQNWYWGYRKWSFECERIIIVFRVSDVEDRAYSWDESEGGVCRGHGGWKDVAFKEGGGVYLHTRVYMHDRSIVQSESVQNRKVKGQGSALGYCRARKVPIHGCSLLPRYTLSLFRCQCRSPMFQPGRQSFLRQFGALAGRDQQTKLWRSDLLGRLQERPGHCGSHGLDSHFRLSHERVLPPDLSEG